MDWYPRYSSLWRSKTRHLDPYQEGCYLRLVDEYMEMRQPLPDDDRALARIIGISLEEWQTNACGIVRAFFVAQNGVLFHDRCDKILAEQDARSKTQSEKSKKGAEARWKKNKVIDACGIASGNGQAMPEDAKRQDKTEQSGAKAPSPKVAEPPPPLFDKFWEAYPKARRDSKNKTLPAYRKALTRTTEEVIYEAVIRYSASDEVARGFAKGTIAWLNADRWTVDYRSPSPQGQAVNGKPSYGDSIKNAARTVYDLLEEEERVRAQAN